MGIPTANISVSIQKLAPEVVADIGPSRFSSFLERYGLYILMAVLLGVMVVLMIPRGRKLEEELPEALGEAALAGTQLTVSDAAKQKLPDIELEERMSLNCKSRSLWRKDLMQLLSC